MREHRPRKGRSPNIAVRGLYEEFDMRNRPSRMDFPALVPTIVRVLM